MERTGLDWTLAFGGFIGAIIVTGTVVLAFANRPIPSVLSTGDLSVIGFFFTKGITQTIANVIPKRDPPAPEPKP